MESSYEGLYYKVPSYCDLRELIAGSAEKFGDRPAFLVKDKKGGEYREITYSQFQADIRAMGTFLMSLGLLGEKIAIIGENCYDWIVTYYAVVNGLGIVVPLDKELSPPEIRLLLDTADCKAVFYTGTYREVFKNHSIPHKFEMSLYTDRRDKTNPGEWTTLLASGYELLEQGNTAFLDSTIDPEAVCALLFRGY